SEAGARRPRGFGGKDQAGWHDYADAWLEGHLGRFLDYGCGPGAMLKRVMHRTDEAWGVDVDGDALPQGLAGAQVRAIRSGEPLPFEDETFDTIAILEVIEHVSNERATLTELTRVLKPGGRLILTTPHKGLLTFLDPGNAKFVAPKVHRLIHRYILRNPEYYSARFGGERQEQTGMIGDFTTDQDCWHRHYRYSEIRALAPEALKTVGWAAYFPGMRLCWCAHLGAKVLSRGRYTGTPWPFGAFSRWASHQETLLGDQLVVLFRKA
ncbi:MAG: class I SAM-dependent methyltransferase, partial [Acidobacteriota bacterium]|nr:class I SAM-dependent methyltransferase [Acidobacteriota bacterium]